jgi:hypothetical protein
MVAADHNRLGNPGGGRRVGGGGGLDDGAIAAHARG